MQIYVFCKSENIYTGRQIAEFYKFSGEFEDDLKFDPDFDSEKLTREDWSGFSVNYRTGKEEVIIGRLVPGDAEFQDSLEDVFELHQDRLKKLPEVEKHLKASKQIYTFEFDAFFLDEDAWDVMDRVEWNLAKDLDGLVVADEGFYDKELARIGD
jgi:hypothetical protein